MSSDTPERPPAPSGPAAGWYDDPQQPGHLRYWDGSAWTSHTRPKDPLPAAPPPPPSGDQQQVVYVQQAGNGLAVAALVLGIIGVVLGLVPILFFLAWILGILALVLGLVARNRAKKTPQVGRKTMATWGAVLGAAAIALGVVGVVIVNDVFEDTGEELQDLGTCIEEADTPEELEDC